MDLTNPHFDEEDLALVRERRYFSVQLAPHRFDESQHLAIHDTVLRPLLALARECWVYELEQDSPAFHAAAELLTPHKAKWAICLSGDPVTGHEYFWNATGGKRGTVVMTMGSDSLVPVSIFPHCHDVFIFSNLGAGHSPSAMRLARSRVQSGERIAITLSRNNGLEWMDIHAARDLAQRLFLAAQQLVQRGTPQ